MGWLALELGRCGQTVDAYDLSPEAIAVARRMLDENPYKDGFGKVTYHLEDVTKLDLGTETLDAVSGWSAFHHLPDLMSFMDRVHQALKPGGIVVMIFSQILASPLLYPKTKESHPKPLTYLFWGKRISKIFLCLF